MPDTHEFKVNVAGNLGKKYYKEYMTHAFLLQSRIERNGQVIQEERAGYTPQDLMNYWVEKFYENAVWLRERPDNFNGGLNAEDLFIQHVISRIHVGRVYVNGTLNSFLTGDFSYLYRSLMMYVRCYYASDIYYETQRGKGFASGTGTDHGTYFDAVIACFALKRPDYARRFFPRELGLVTRSHVTLNRVGSLIVGLLYDDDAWKEKALQDARKYLQGKRQISESAVVSYLVGLYEGNTASMSENLQLLMDNYRKATWLVMGDACRLSLYGFYLMAKLFLPENLFQQVQRPKGPGWWDEYVDLCLQNPLPASIDAPYITFPEPLDFMQEFLEAIDKGLEPESIILSLDIARR